MTTPDMSLIDSVTIEDVRAAAARLEGVARRTPVHTSRQLDERTGASVFLKCESFQRVGAFKFRGAYNALSRLSDVQKARGVLTYSSGNHAQAVALAARLLGIRATIVMPSDAPKVKLAATRGYLGYERGADPSAGLSLRTGGGGNADPSPALPARGEGAGADPSPDHSPRTGSGGGAEGEFGRVVLYDKAQVTREELGARLADEGGLTIVPPYDHPDVIAGQGTTALELFEEVGELDALYVCVGGGGLLSGCATAARAISPTCRVVGVEPAMADDAARSFASGELCTVRNPETIADGARTPSLGRYTFPIVMDRVDAFVTVSEEEIVEAMRFVWERMKLVIEPTGALGVAGLLKEGGASGRVGVIISGGNVDVEQVGALFRT